MFSLLTSIHMSLVKANHSLVYTEATEFAGNIKHHLILPHCRGEQQTVGRNGLWTSCIFKALPSLPRVGQILQSLKRSQEHQGQGGNRLPLSEKEMGGCASACMEQQERAVALASDSMASAFGKEGGRWFSSTAMDIWSTNCAALLDAKQSSYEIRLFRWPLPCMWRGFCSFKSRIVLGAKSFVDLWATANSLFYKGKILITNQPPTPEFLGQCPISILFPLLFTWSEPLSRNPNSRQN